MLRKIVSTFSSVKNTCLKQLHIDNKGKLVNFAGYNLPVYYSKGIIKEHLHCRSHASLFDVSHMGQLIITGPDRIKLLQRTTVGSTNRKSNDKAVECYLTMFLNEKGGIIDDAIATNVQSQQTVRIVVNGANKYIVLEHLHKVIKQQQLNVYIQLLEQNGLIALQGPKSSEVLSDIIKGSNLSQIPFMSQFKAQFDGKHYTITRSGYTGEDGFQIASTGPNIASITKAILNNPIVQLAGLGSRDSLRLEAGLCLHGHDINTETTPLQAALTWAVYKRKHNDSRLKYIGEDALVRQTEEVKSKKISIRKRVGFILKDIGVVREHCKIYTASGRQVGETTSGSPSPSLKQTIGMAYIEESQSSEGNQLLVEQRGKKYTLKISKMPFVASNYYKRWPK